MSLNRLKGELWEIQGLLYILVSKILETPIWQKAFFWYGVFCIVSSLLYMLFIELMERY